MIATFQCSANFKIIGKTSPEQLSYAGAFQFQRFTVTTFSNHITKGHPVAAAKFCGKNGDCRRLQVNANYAEIVGIDIDNTEKVKGADGKFLKDENGKFITRYSGELPIEAAKQHPIISAYSFLGVESPSSTHEWNKERFWFRYPRPVKGWRLIRICQRYLIYLIGVADPACKDAGRYFFGSPGRKPFLLNEQAVLPETFIEDAIEWDKDLSAKLQAEAEANRQKAIKWQEQLDSDNLATLAEAAWSHIAAYHPGQGRYDLLVPAIAGTLRDLGSQGRQILLRWDAGRGRWGRAFERLLDSIENSHSDRKATVASAFYLAKQESDFKFPEFKHDPVEFKDQSEYDRYIAEQSEVEKAIEAEENHRAYEQLQRIESWLKGGSKCKSAVKGFTRTENTGEEPTQDDIFRFVSPNDRVRLRQQAEKEGLKGVVDLSMTGAGKTHGWTSLTNEQLGVSVADTQAGEHQGRVWFVDRGHTNPTTAPLEDTFENLPPRTKGWVKDPVRKTPSGKSHLKHAGKNEKPSVPGNCNNAEAFNLGSSKGVRFAGETATTHPACLSCKMFDACGNNSGNGYGYRYERRQVLARALRIRASFDSLPSPDVWDYSQDEILIEEALQQLAPVKSIEASIKDFDSMLAELEEKCPDQYELLKPYKQQLRIWVDGRDLTGLKGKEHDQIIEMLGSIPEGLDIDLITQKVGLSAEDFGDGDRPDQVNTGELTQQITKLRGKVKRKQDSYRDLQQELGLLQQEEAIVRQDQGQIDFSFGKKRVNRKGKYAYTESERQKFIDRLVELPLLIAELGDDLRNLETDLRRLESERDAAQKYNQNQFREAKDRILEILENAPNQWLVPFLRVWAGLEPGALRIGKFGGLRITVRNDRQTEIIAAVKQVIFLDATAKPEILALHAGLDLSQIKFIKQALPPTKNLTVTQVKGFSLCGKSRSESTTKRVNNLVDWARKKHGKVAVFDHMIKRDETNADGWHHGNDARGTNRFEDYNALVIVGLPMPDLGVIKDRWLTLGGEATGIPFDRYYNSFIDAEIIQEVGRLRAVRRLDEELAVYVLFDTDRANFDYELPASLNPVVKDVAEICIEAAPLKQRVWQHVEEIIKAWYPVHKTIPTQEQIAAQIREQHPEILKDDDNKKISVTRGWISKLAEQFVGGWQQLKKVFHALLTTLPAAYSDKVGESLPANPEQEYAVNFYATQIIPAIQNLPGINVAAELNLIIQSIKWHGFKHVISRISHGTRWALINALFDRSDPVSEFEF